MGTQYSGHDVLQARETLSAHAWQHPIWPFTLCPGPGTPAGTAQRRHRCAAGQGLSAGGPPGRACTLVLAAQARRGRLLGPEMLCQPV